MKLLKEKEKKKKYQKTPRQAVAMKKDMPPAVTPTRKPPGVRGVIPPFESTPASPGRGHIGMKARVD